MSILSATIGKSVSFRKTVSESDVYLFAGITGDFSPNHVDEEFMQGTPYGGRIAHGALLVGYMSGCSTDIVAQCGALATSHFPVSLGYDRIRFLSAVTIGETIELFYKITSVVEDNWRTIADVTISTRKSGPCCVATHLMKWLPKSLSSDGG
jgi:3-hydroxybutyryl-CoA dehydratase